MVPDQSEGRVPPSLQDGLAPATGFPATSWLANFLWPCRATGKTPRRVTKDIFHRIARDAFEGTPRIPPERFSCGDVPLGWRCIP